METQSSVTTAATTRSRIIWLFFPGLFPFPLPFWFRFWLGLFILFSFTSSLHPFSAGHLPHAADFLKAAVFTIIKHFKKKSIYPSVKNCSHFLTIYKLFRIFRLRFRAVPAERLRFPAKKFFRNSKKSKKNSGILVFIVV